MKPLELLALPVLLLTAVAAQADFAIVLGERVPQSLSLPEPADVASDPAKAAAAYRQAGMQVVADPTGRYFAVLAPPHVTDEDLTNGAVSKLALAVGLVERLTPEQLAARTQGYLQLDQTTPVQQSAVLRLLVKQGHLKTPEQGREPDRNLRLGVWTNWVRYVTMMRNGSHFWHEMEGGYGPPLAPAVQAPPLTGSPLAWLWALDDPRLGEATISVASGTYATQDLLAQIAKANRTGLLLPGLSGTRDLRVVAEDAPLPVFLWLLAMAAGRVPLPSQVNPGVVFTVPDETAQEYWQYPNMTRPAPELGYFSMTDLPAGRLLLAQQPVPQDGQYWIAWRFGDLPLMYRNQVKDSLAWEQRQYDVGELEETRAVVLWAACVTLSIEQNRGGQRIRLPAY